MNKGTKLFQGAVVMICLTLVPAYSATRYIQIRANRANVRSAARTSATIVATAQKGDIFELRDETRDWYQVRLFSGDWRYIHRSLAEPVSYKVEVPEDRSLRREMFLAFGEADRQAQEEADARYSPASDLRKNIEHSRLLRDRYRLRVAHRFSTPAPVYRSIVVEGTQKGW